jgi:hypothetical protein
VNPGDLQVEIKARSPGEAVALAARMLQHRPGPFLGAWAFYSAGVILLGYLMMETLGLHWGWMAGLVPVLAPIFALPMITTVGNLVFSPKVSFATVAAATLRRGAAYLVLFLANRVVTLVGLAFFIVPGLYLWRSSWFLAPIVALEGSSLGASFRRGRRFAIGFNAHVASHALNSALLVSYLTVAFASLGHFLTVKVFGQTFTFLAELPTDPHVYYPYLGLVGFALAAPFATLVWFFVYLDVRIRKEGWDLEIAFRTRAAKMTEQSRGI